MKKLFYSMFALAALAMTNTSCSDELENGATNPNEAAVTFTVQLENNVGSRAAGDGTQATKLQYWVYKAEADTIGTIINGLTGETTVNSDLTAEVSLTLVKGQTYNFLFWAQDPDCTYYTPVPAEGVITVNNYVGPANDESRDAFFKVRKDLKVTGPVTETIVLKRPFSQINVGTSIGSLADAKKADVDIAQSNFTVDNAATRLNTYSGSATMGQAVSYSLANIIESNKADKVGDLKNVDGKDYEHLAMNYILVADYTDNNTTDEYGVGENKQLVNTTFEIFDNNNASINKFEVPNVPVQRNWRTNIIGDILNESVTFNVVIDPTFDNDHNYVIHEELAYAALNGGEVTLEEDVELEQSLVVAEGVNMVLNLNGNTITNKLGNSATDAIIVEEGATLTINGDGDITAVTGNDGYAVISEGTLIINGGTYHAGVDENGETNAVIYARGNGKIYVNGGTFPNEANSAFVLNKKDSDRATTEIVVKGGTFTNFDPANNAAEGTGTNFVAEGYKVTNVGDYYYVTKEDVTAAANATDLASALATAGEVAMVEDVTIASTVTIADGATLDGQGNTVTMTKNNTQTALAPSKGGTIKNLNIEGYNTRNEAGNVIRGILETNITGDLVLDNVNISGVAYPINIQAKDFVPTSSLTVKGSTLVGWTSYTGLTSASFTDCTFAVGNYFDATVAGQETWNGCIKPYVTSTFTGCEFGEGFVLDLSALKADATLTFENCTVNGVALTALSQLGVTGSDTRVTIM